MIYKYNLNQSRMHEYLLVQKEGKSLPERRSVGQAGR